MIKNDLSEHLVVGMVNKLRHEMPRIGGRKLYHLLNEELHQVGKIGRDKFFSVLKKNNLLVPRKRSFTRTTNSYHRFYK